MLRMVSVPPCCCECRRHEPSVLVIETSVVIPTAGRRPEQLRAAVESVLCQRDCGLTEIIVVDDSESGTVRDQLRDVDAGKRLVIVRAPRQSDVGQRTIGVRHAAGRWIAFLDDDDQWESNKLTEQIRMAEQIEQSGKRPIVSSRVCHTFDHNDSIVHGVPARLITSGMDVSDYLFYRRSPSSVRESIFTSTLLVEAELARSVPWRRLPRHQDWDWLLRAARQQSVVVQHHPDELATIHVGSTNSISASNDWEESLRWADSAGSEGLMTTRAYTDFLVAQTMRYALGSRSPRGVALVARRLVASGKVPSLRALVIGFSGIVPRRGLQRLMSHAPGSP